jgi:S-adenosylmethionine hydrolase
MQFRPTVTPTSIIGHCIHIDDFGNVITNITKDFFEEERKERKFSISLPGTEINKISSYYDDVSPSTALAMFNSFGYLEIAINHERASNRLFPRNMQTNTNFGIPILFED